MGLYEESKDPREMYWFGPSESAYEPGCDISPTMPHLHHDHPAHHATHYFPDGVHSHLHDHGPLTPSSSTSSSSSLGGAHPGPPFVSPGSEGSHFVSHGSDVESSSMVGSPCSASTNGTQDLTGCTNTITTSTCTGVSNSHVKSSTGGKRSELSCAGCSGRIIDRYYLSALEKCWHEACLRCSACHLPIENSTSCFTKDGNIFCRDDYFRLFRPQRCARCTLPISGAQFGLRAKEYVYHVQCFTCVQCHVQLTKGEHFGMNGPHIYCTTHYQIQNLGMDGGHISPLSLPQGPFQGPLLPPIPPHLTSSHVGHHPQDGMQPYPPPENITKMQFFNGVGAPHKGRPRKRKPKEEPMDTNMNIQSGFDMDGGYGPLGNACQSSVRTKRIRTSFKHNQLRTMKAYFNMNHNPDAKDLKQLSAKTNLSKRVLQVWFQNARAKWRRQMMAKEKGSGGGTESGSSGAALQDSSGTADGTASDYTPSPQSMPPPMSPDESSNPSATQLPYQKIM